MNAVRVVLWASLFWLTIPHELFAQSLEDGMTDLPAAHSAIRSAARTPPPPGPPLRPPNMAWVNAKLAEMTLQDKITQMIIVSYNSGTADDYVLNKTVGGFIFQGNSNLAANIVAATNHLQEITSVPLLFAVDCEAGLGSRVMDATRFPMNMGLASARRTDLAYQQGGVTARECRAVGIHIGFGPVLDVNTEHINPIIGIRSYSENPTLVAQMAQAYMQGANAEGLLCTYKHYPGHGMTTGDTHSSLQTTDISEAELQATHIAPYSTLFASGTVDLVMSSHVWYTALDPGTTPWPATLSTAALTRILRNQLGYTGTVISDSFGMSGLTQACPTYDAVRKAVLAGLDIILTPASYADARNGLYDAVVYGVGGEQIPMSRIDDAVRRILVLKSRAGMPETTTVSASAVPGIISHPDHLAVAREIGIRTITGRIKRPADLPLTSTQSVLVYNLQTNNTIFYRYPETYFNDELTSYLPSAVCQNVPTTISDMTTLVNAAKTKDRVIVASYEWKPTVYTDQDTLVKQLISAGVHPIYVSFGSPYQFYEFPGLQVENFFTAYSSHFESQREMARELVGVGASQGQWPVTVPVKLSRFNLE